MMMVLCMVGMITVGANKIPQGANTTSYSPFVLKTVVVSEKDRLIRVNFDSDSDSDSELRIPARAYRVLG